MAMVFPVARFLLRQAGAILARSAPLESATSRHLAALGPLKASYLLPRRHVAHGSPCPQQLPSTSRRDDTKCQATSAAGNVAATVVSPMQNPAPVPLPSCLPPAAAYEKVVALGVEKAESSFQKTLVLSILAGVYIGFGGLLAFSVGGACTGLAQTNPGLQKLVLGLFGLPTGLLMVLVCGAELFTGNTALLPVAWFERKATLAQLAKNWSVSYLGNFAGSLLLVKLVALTGLLATAQAPLAIAAAKTSLTFVEAFTRGILANWLVCIAVWQAAASSSLPGKALGVLLPISAFVAMGMEHSVANMFMIPAGIFACGADISFKHFLTANLLPVTLGNIVGGALCVATPYALAYGRKAVRK